MVCEDVELLRKDGHEVYASDLKEHEQEEPDDNDPPESADKVVEQEGNEEGIHRAYYEIWDTP